MSSLYNRIVSDEAYKQQMSAAVGPGSLNLLFSQAGLLSFVEQSGTGPSDLPADRLKMVSLFDDLRFYADDNDVVGTKVVDLEVWNNEPVEEVDPFHPGQTILLSPDPYRSQSAIHLFSPEADRHNYNPTADHAQVYPSLRCIKIDQPKACGEGEDLFYFEPAEANAGCGNSENLRSALGFPELYLKPSGQPAIEENIDPEGYCLDRNTVYNATVSTDSVFTLGLRYADGAWRSHELAIEQYPDLFEAQQIISLLYRCRN